MRAKVSKTSFPVYPKPARLAKYTSCFFPYFQGKMLANGMPIVPPFVEQAAQDTAASSDEESKSFYH